eukprot:COSAG05_NODE_5509_length_1157_cov_1.235350_2_plen_274_part_01
MTCACCPILPALLHGCSLCWLPLRRCHLTHCLLHLLALSTQMPGVKQKQNPINFTGGVGAFFPSTVWKSGDHYNFLAAGYRYTTKDSSFHTWSRVMPRMLPFGDSGGQWFQKLPPAANGTTVPPGSPQMIVNTKKGSSYAFGDYFPSNETWVTAAAPAGNHYGGSTEETGGFTWGVGQWAGARFLTIGWAEGSHPLPNFPNDGGFLTMLTEVQYDSRTMSLISNPLRELQELRNASLGVVTGLHLTAAGAPHVLAGVGDVTAASADVLATFALP